MNDYLNTLLAFVGICPFIITEWSPLSDKLVWFLEFQLMSHLVWLASVEVDTNKS